VPALTKQTIKRKGEKKVTQVNRSVVPLQGLSVLASEPLSKEH